MKVINLVLSIALFTACADKEVQLTESGVLALISEGSAKRVRLEVISDNVIRVTASPEETLGREVNLISDRKQAAKPEFTVAVSGDTIILATSTTQARLLKKTGRVIFAGAGGEVILSEREEGGREFTPFEAGGVKGYSLRQIFDGAEDEALYGLGQHQSDEFNYKGLNEELFQYNTKVSVPMIVSSKGYGILWHNYSLSRFGDKRPYGGLHEAFTLYDAAGAEGGITASYYGDSSGKEIIASRIESDINYEDLGTIRDLPQGFPTGQAAALWEGELEPVESGLHCFKLHYAGYATVYIDGEKVVPERWRTAWNPNDYKVRLEMEKGRRYKLRIEWKPDGNVSYLGLKVLAPATDTERQEIAMWSEMGDAVDYYFINGGSIDGAIAGYRTVTGKSQIMPRWAMGYWLSREHYRTQDELLATLEEYRRREVPLDVIVQDWNYWTTGDWGSHEFDSTRYPDPAGMIRQVHNQKARFMISVWPKFYLTTEHYKEFESINSIYKQAISDSIRDWIYPGYIGSFYDAYNPEARKLFWEQIDEHLYSLGVDAWWMDASEPNIQDNTDMEYRKLLCGPTALGPSAKYFNAYALVNAEAIYDGQRGSSPDDRVFLLTRSGFAGQQRYSTATWSGDIATRWEDMKSQISAGLNFAMSGIPYWTMDIGGFCVENRYAAAKEGSADMEEWRELNTRWYQFGAFCPLFRSHGQYPYREIYNISSEGAPAYRSMKYYNELRYRLLPYIYSLAGMTYTDDYTIMRALVMDYPGDRETYGIGDQFMFGSALMACPVYEYKARCREVYFPEGIWYDFYTGRSFSGGRRLAADAPYEKMPLFVRAGSIIPTGDLIQSTAEAQEDIYIYVYAGADGSFKLYEDNGLTYEYERGGYSVIPLEYDDRSRTLVIGKRLGS
ncbi:MAG: DUF5110 domain-containing protein, partial [Tannerellaceae bacterium]|nr:DUF5110 domain-containing protein [Tannerellaceae bacterium]